MPLSSGKKRRKQNKGFKMIIWLLIFAVAAVGAAFLVSNYYEDTKLNFQKSNYPQKYSEYVDKAAEDYELDPALIYAVIKTESNFEPSAESKAGARGIMQMMPSSFEWLQSKRGVDGEYTSDDLFDPAVCIDYGSYLLRYFLDYYGNERCAVAAYNAGFVVSDWLSDSAYSTDGETLSSIPYPETSNYVDKVESAKQMYINLYYS